MPIPEKSVIAEGFNLFGQVLTIIIIIGMFVIFLYVLIWIAKKFFYNVPIPDIVKVERERTVSSCYLSCPSTIYEHLMFLTGRGRTGTKCIGKIKGYTEEEVRINTPTGKTKKVKNEDGEYKEVEILKEVDVKQDVFLLNVHRFHWLPLIGRFFSKLLVVKLLKDEHTDLVGDINVFSSGLREEKGYWYTTERINKAVVTILQDMKQRLHKTMILDQLQAEGVITGLVNETNVRLIHDLSRREGLIGRIRKQEPTYEKGP